MVLLVRTEIVLPHPGECLLNPGHLLLGYLREDKLLNIIGWEIKSTIISERFLDPLLISLALDVALTMVVLQESCLLQSRVWLVLQLEEASNDAADISDVVTVLLLAEEELILEQAVLLLENGDLGETTRADLECSLDNLVVIVAELGVVIILDDSPDFRFWFNDSLDLHDTLEDVHGLVTGIVESLHTHEELDDI